MMNELMYSFRENKVRVIMKDNEPWFVSKDVCDVLEIKNSRDALNRLDEDEKGVGLTDTLGGRQEITVINEYGLYSLVLGSRKKEAKEFKRWVTHEVIPSIRKNGMYATDSVLDKAIQDPDFMIGLLTKIKEEREEKEKLQQQVEQQKPKVLLAESIENSNDLILIGDLAKILKQNGHNIGQNRLFERLRDMGYLVKRGASKNSPTQRSMDLGLFKIVEGTYNSSSGSKITKTTKVTGRGQRYFVNKFLKEVKNA